MTITTIEPEKTEKAWNFIRDRFFDRRTCLFYDFLCGNGDDAATWHLPSPDQINGQIPNPCGYGTGMEDSMLSAGTMLDTVIARYEVTGEEFLRGYAADIYRGMELCASVSNKRGFLPRSVSPIDGHSHYTNSSRDQYTHWFYGAYKLFYSPLSSEAQRESIRTHLVEMSRLFEREVIPENDYALRREDDGESIVCKMWGDLNPHEYLRLPMLYLLTFKITNDTHIKDMYLTYRDTAMEKTLDYIPLSGRTYVALQLQYSLRLCYDLDDDEVFRSRCLDMMRRLTTPYEELAARQAKGLMNSLDSLRWKYTPWDRVSKGYTNRIGGRDYFNPGQSEWSENTAFYPLRAVGEGIAAAALCPGYRVSDETLDLLCRLADAVDYDDHYSYAPMALINAYWLARNDKGVT